MLVACDNYAGCKSGSIAGCKSGSIAGCKSGIDVSGM